MGQDDLIISSTSDTADQMRAALVHGIEPPADETILTTIDTEDPTEEKPAEEEASVETPAAKVEEKPEKKAAAVEEKPKPKVKADAPKREDFESEDAFHEAMGDHKAQKRIAKLTWEREEEKRQRKALQDRVEALEKKPVAKVEEKPAVETKAETTAKPKAEDYATHEEWLEALTTWNTETVTKKAVTEAIDAERAKAAAKDQEEVVAEQHRRYQETRVEAQARYDDFDEVIASAAEMPVTGSMNYVMLTSKVGHDIAYYLASNRDEAAAIYALPGADQIRAMGELEGRMKTHVAALEAGAAPATEEVDEDSGEPVVVPKPKPRPVTKTPEPITPVGGRKTTGTVREEDMTPREWMEKRNREEAGRKKFRR